MRTKSCKFGVRCKFSHDASTPLQTSQPYIPNTLGIAPDGKLRQWKRLLNLGDYGWNSPELTTTNASRFFQLGLELMDGDVGAVQDAIKLLAKDSGLAFIRALTDVHIPRANAASKTMLWETEVKPLFALITHPRVVDSAVLEQQVADMFNYMLGIEGQRMKKFFDFIIQLVSEPRLATQRDSPMEILELSLSVLSKIIDCNTRNIVNSECDRLVSLFAEIVKSDPGEKDQFSCLQASKYIEYMQQRMDTGKGIAELNPSRRVLLAREDFVLRHDLPGTLSADGPRHNNDHVDITKIKIMPTYDEIVSPRREYLPTNNPSTWHVKGIRGRLDREFRLVREDTVGQLRDAVRDILELAREPNHNKARQSNTLRTYTYENPVIIDVHLHRIGGLDISIRCPQLPVVSKLNAKKRKDWWVQSKRLQAGALVCLFNVAGSMLFCVVSDTTRRFKEDKDARIFEDRDEDQLPVEQVRSLSDDPDFLSVNLKLVDPTASEVSQAMRWYKNIKSYPRRYLVEFPGVLLDSFKHSLSALRKMHEKPNLPFTNLLAPKEGSSPDVDIKLPQYATKPGFTFDLSCITNGNVPLTVDPRSPISPQALSLKSSLDPTQSAALLNTLTRGLSLIQGPPGTGKSYTGEKIIKVLLKSKQIAKLGPILCVCYTNHALDQLLEHLLDDGTKRIIRIGSRSKSERLQALNLRSVTKGLPLTKSEKSGLWDQEQKIREHVQDGKDLLKELDDCQSWKAIKNWLAIEYPNQYAELFGEDQDGWQTVIHQPEIVIDRWLQGGQHNATHARPLQHLERAQLNSMTNHERKLLHRHWAKSIRDPIIAKLARLNQDYNDAIRRRDEIRGDVDLRCLNDADIVGVTTTGLARNLTLLRKLRCKVMICEEAGEVLESHILTALLPSIEHAILIGDHLQLRPQIQNFDLQSTNPRGKQYSLDVSLFERLVQPPNDNDLRIPCSMLETQRRMHPSIAELIRSTLYPSLNDAKVVEDYPQVVGMKRRLFWFHHDRPENAVENSSSLNTSRSNSFEVDMTAALVSHLSQQGTYRPGDIAVLTPYLGQLQLLRRRMESMFEIYVNDRDLEDLEAAQDEDSGANRPQAVALSKTTLLKSVRVATVDNFQGEEAKVIVISLVRSNPQGDCGFLKTSNRINVLLSRAKHAATAAASNATRAKTERSQYKIMAYATSAVDESTRLVSITALRVVTVMHPVNRARNGAKCEVILDCGHQCPSLCGEVCPASKFCQICATDEVKSVCVDFLEMKEYRDIDLDQEPCIFPDCGHFLTVSSMDGQMDMAAHYKLDINGLPELIMRSSEPFAMENNDVKGCATCRGPLRNISRYGRIVRRAMLDEATKKFISWSNAEYLSLAAKLITEQESLAAMKPIAIRDAKSGAAGNLTIGGSRQRQLNLLRSYVEKRYDSILKMRKSITLYNAKVQKEEQPFQRVADLVRHANLHHGGQNEFRYDESVIQAKGSLLALTVLLKCDLLILSDFFRLLLGQKSHLAKPDVKLDLSPFMRDCDILIQRAKHAVYPREEAQGHIFYAQLCAFSRSLVSTPPKTSGPGTETPLSIPTYDPDTLDKLRDQGLDHVHQARRILTVNQSANALKNEVDAAEEALLGGVYRPVTAEELRQVYAASMGELSGTGHWYTCPNGHPFTINNCGMAMEEAQCPECGARIGGRNHRSVEGVRRAVEIEEIAREMEGVRL
ncbi:Zinc finger, CCCH-type [Fusarium austroafricanum]|uniref:Zinc finger, CCCH-type n=1 Tax=Fusarium austroafricanum TaxID=2364996 RepID=A0A8H4JVG2_9HYPO|nr:Zinc finger, CCCH-type [Fusarium austroafricanum]